VTETLREVVEALAPLERGAGTDGERRAAEWLADRLRRAGARDARVETVPFRDGYARMLLPLNLLPLTGRRVPALVAALLIADDVSNYKRLWRRAVTRPKTTTNVIAEAGDPESDRTLVVLAHHDAAPTGLVFDQAFQRWLARRFPGLVARSDTSLPLWWSVVAGPLLVALGARRMGRIVAILAGLFGLDIARHRIVPGANDNLSGCAALVALAERDDLPVRVILASCGAEEVLQGGIYAFVEDHLKRLDPARTWVLNLDTIGSPELFMLEGEGPFVMEDYRDPSFRDRVARAAERTGAPLRRGCRARSSTDSVVPSRAGYPTTCLCSWEPETKLLTNYHLPTDLPEHLRYETIERAVEITAALAEDLGRDG
jgi:hypothetical protein